MSIFHSSAVTAKLIGVHPSSLSRLAKLAGVVPGQIKRNLKYTIQHIEQIQKYRDSDRPRMVHKMDKKSRERRY